MTEPAPYKPPILVGTRRLTPHIYVTGTKQVLTNVHDPSECEGQYCVVHAPSKHPLVNAPTHWRVGLVWDPKLEAFRGGEIMERICPCGIFHPDPDDLAFVVRRFGTERADELTSHDCCGCCRD